MLERKSLRIISAAMAIIAAIVYFLIAAGLVYRQPAGSPVTTSAGDPRMIMVMAGVVFVIGAALLLAFDKRLIYIPGIVLQIIVLVGYVMIAPQRVPEYEFFGLLCKVAQVILLGVLVYLVVKPDALRSSQPTTVR